jgi:hypothetical protein
MRITGSWTRERLADAYGVGRTTFWNWQQRNPKLHEILEKAGNILTPAEVQACIDVLGPPEVCPVCKALGIDEHSH